MTTHVIDAPVTGETRTAQETRFLSRGEVARLFGVSGSTVTRWARSGLLKAVRTPGGHYRFPADETKRAAMVGIEEPR